MNPIGKALIFGIELLSQFMRLVSLSVRLFANILAGHLLLLFMGVGSPSCSASRPSEPLPSPWHSSSSS